ncbi:Clp protease ClpP [Hymenobacter sp. BT18]|uniref:Clp protease ClpP n=1 Tax=Hymenobacter sp. BT18 TaxID=2835648 RepID=UPI00143EED3C|nr:Clp protease ClpP [Hymenobacter sp. BT18]QIX61859.1 Clp protease ClpP [Hymenobacter sp. BT18]
MEVRYLCEGYSAFDSSLEQQLPEVVELHFWKCYGGEVYEGYSIYNYLRGLAKQGVVVKSYSHGLCASIAVLVYLAGDERYTDEASQFFTHKPMCDLGAYANADDMRTAANSLDKIQDQIAGVYASRGGMSAEQAQAFMNSDAWITADEAVAAGFATAKTSGELVAPAGAEKVINYFKPPQTPQNMAITPADEQRLVDKFINAAKAFFLPRNEAAEETSATTNMTVALADGTSIYVDAAGDDIAQGDLVYTDEAMTTVAADGDYTLADGRTIAVAAGAITSITEAPENNAGATNTADLEAANARIAELEAEVAAKTNEVTNATNTVRALQNKLKTVPGAGNPTPPGSTNSLPIKTGSAKPAAQNSLPIRTQA